MVTRQHGDHFMMYKITECCTSETNISQYKAILFIM